MAKLVIGTNKQTVIPAIVRGGASPAHYIERTVDANGKLISSANIINLNGVTDVGDGMLAYAYYGASFPANTSADLSDLITISGQNACQDMFNGCSGITSVDLSRLTTINGVNTCGRMFQECTELTSVDLSGLTTIGGVGACSAMFQNCSGVTSVDLSNLTAINGQAVCNNMFNGCTGITSVDLSDLTTVSGTNSCNYMFLGCTGLTSIDLSGLTTMTGTTVCQYMFSACTGLTSVDLSGLTTITGANACTRMFGECTGLKTVKLNALNTMPVQIAPSYGQMFFGCTRLESVEFGGLTASTFASKTDQIAYLFNNITGAQATNGCTVHFPSNFDPSDPDHTFDASTLTGYPTFGGDASYIHVAFDLPATE